MLTDAEQLAIARTQLVTLSVAKFSTQTLAPSKATAKGSKPTPKVPSIATVGYYYGLSTRGGTQGVGPSTTQAMVVSSVLFPVVNYFTSQLLLWLLKP